MDEYRARQARLTDQFRTDDLPIISSPPFATHSNDVHYRYRTSSDLLYLTGWAEPETILVIRHAYGNWNTSIFVQPKDTLKEIWEGRRPGIDGAMTSFAVNDAYNNTALGDELGAWLNEARRVFVHGGINHEVDDLVQSAVRRRDRARQHFGSGPVSVEDPSSLLAELRLRKSASEIEQMTYASKVTSLAHELAMRHSREGVTEYQLQSVIEGFFSYAGTSGWSYPSIVGCGENATILHYTTNQATCGQDEVILIDAELNTVATPVTSHAHGPSRVRLPMLNGKSTNLSSARNSLPLKPVKSVRPTQHPMKPHGVYLQKASSIWVSSHRVLKRRLTLNRVNCGTGTCTTPVIGLDWMSTMQVFTSLEENLVLSNRACASPLNQASTLVLGAPMSIAPNDTPTLAFVLRTIFS